ncbi:MAG TPA: hypothetical protein DCS60_02150 [Opitutae bacterium]|nr:hypothetical protein [Opitutae bacterium]
MSQTDAAALLNEFGCNKLPGFKTLSMRTVFLHKFASPIIYVLLATDSRSTYGTRFFSNPLL